jgi:hypothetical protein
MENGAMIPALTGSAGCLVAVPQGRTTLVNQIERIFFTIASPYEAMADLIVAVKMET